MFLLMQISGANCKAKIRKILSQLFLDYCFLFEGLVVYVLHVTIFFFLVYPESKYLKCIFLSV